MTKEHTSEEIKYRLSDLGVQIGNIAIEYIADLEKENAELKSKDCWKSCEYANSKSELIGQHIKDVQNLTKAKELLKMFIETSNPIYFEEDRQKVKAEAERFLKDLEK